MEEDRNRDGAPDGWRPMAFDSPAQLDWDENVAHDGRRSARIRDSFRPGDQRDWKQSTGRWVSAAYPVEAGSETEADVQGAAVRLNPFAAKSIWVEIVAGDR